MASTNQSPFYQTAEKKFLEAQTDEERIPCLEEMIKECPKHKSAENMLRNLTTRLKKLKQSIERRKKSGKGKREGIKKADMQLLISGMPNTGKSTLFNILTNQNTKISPQPYTTYKPQLGTTKFEDVKIQTIDLPPFPNHNKSLLSSTDTIILTADKIEQLSPSIEHLKNTRAKIIIIFTKVTKEKERKIIATLHSKYKKYSPVLFPETREELLKLKQTIFKTFPIIRIYTKEPKKPSTKDPMILKKDSTIKIVAEKILKGMSSKIKKARIWGPSSKFSGQTVGLEHQLKDKDIVEFSTT